MKRGRFLENEVREVVAKKLGKKIKNSGLFISQEHPMLAGSPDGICEDSVVEIKCPISSKTYLNYIKNGRPSKKCFAQVQMQMYLSGLKTVTFVLQTQIFQLVKMWKFYVLFMMTSICQAFLKVLLHFGNPRCIHYYVRV